MPQATAETLFCEAEWKTILKETLLLHAAVMLSCRLFILCLLHACTGQELSREALLSWFRERVLEGLALEDPPVAPLRSPGVDVAQPEARHMHRRVPRMSRTSWVSHQTRPSQEMSQIILFPSSDSFCARSDSAPGETPESHFTYHFQPSINNQETQVTSAHFWFCAGKAAAVNSSAELFIVTSEQQLLQAADAPSAMSSDGWTTYHLDHSLLVPVAEGAFLLQVRCPTCQCHTSEPDKMPFLHLHAQPRGPVRSPRHAPVTIPWSPSAIDLLQRPSQERPQHSDCRREAIQISFEELGWENWIVHPKLLTFFYCHGNCSALDRTATMLGITQCCAPVPGSMRSLRITTTSDGGYSFKYETLPNIIPEECACI